MNNSIKSNKEMEGNMDTPKNQDYSKLSMDEIVFDNRNKKYGAYVLRTQYGKQMLKAIAISVSVFILAMFSPDIAKTLGLFKKVEKKKKEVTAKVTKLPEPPPLKKDETPPPPPPPEQKVQRPTTKFLEMVVKQEADQKDPPPDVTQMDDPGKATVDGDDDAPPDLPPPPDPGNGNPGPPKIERFTSVEQMPQFKGGDISDYIGEHLEYPEEEQNEGIEGTAYIGFVVNAEGRVVEIKVNKTSGNSNLDAEAKRVVGKLNGLGFKPGKQRGNPVEVIYEIPIQFTADE